MVTQLCFTVLKTSGLSGQKNIFVSHKLCVSVSSADFILYRM